MWVVFPVPGNFATPNEPEASRIYVTFYATAFYLAGIRSHSAKSGVLGPFMGVLGMVVELRAEVGSRRALMKMEAIHSTGQHCPALSTFYPLMKNQCLTALDPFIYIGFIKKNIGNYPLYPPLRGVCIVRESESVTLPSDMTLSISEAHTPPSGG